jgi:hypothetical protein
MDKMIIMIRPNIWELFFYFLFLAFGIDLIVSGILVLIYNDTSKIPRFLGYLYVKFIENGMKKYKGNDKCVKLIFGLRTTGYYSLMAGLSFFAIGLIMLIEALSKIGQ